MTPSEPPADSSAVSGSDDREPKEAIQLTPPPRQTAKPSLTPPPRQSNSRRLTPSPGDARRPGSKARSIPRSIPRAALFALAAVALYAVFFSLPQWVERRSFSDAAESSTSSGAEGAETAAVAEESALEDEVGTAADLPTVETQRSADPEPVPRLESAESPPAQPSRAVTSPTVLAAEPSGSSSAGDPEPEFTRAMTAGLAALSNGDFAAARSAFDAADVARPGAPEVADGRKQAELGLRLAAVTQHRERAATFEAEERWSDAVSEYEAALALDAHLAFAEQGLKRTRRRAEIDRQLTFHLSRLDRFSSPEVRAEVERLLADSAAVDGAKLTEQRSSLRSALDAAVQPIAVWLESDEHTEVVVYRIGSLGRFLRQSIDLQPGTYTAVGRRAGYRDVRTEFVVAAEAAPQSIRIACEEEI